MPVDARGYAEPDVTIPIGWAKEVAHVKGLDLDDETAHEIAGYASDNLYGSEILGKVVRCQIEAELDEYLECKAEEKSGKKPTS